MSCDNPRCDRGWVQVLPSYAEHLYPEPDYPEGEGPANDELRAKMTAQFLERRAAYEATVYPCKVCAPGLFMRWAGHYAPPGHDLTDCDECADIRRGRRVHIVYPAPPDPDQPGDPDGLDHQERADLR